MISQSAIFFCKEFNKDAPFYFSVATLGSFHQADCPRNQVSGHNYINPFTISNNFYFCDMLRIFIYRNTLTESMPRNPDHGLAIAAAVWNPSPARDLFVDEIVLQFLCSLHAGWLKAIPLPSIPMVRGICTLSKSRQTARLPSPAASR
jgi:hypothetical protein